MLNAMITWDRKSSYNIVIVFRHCTSYVIKKDNYNISQQQPIT